MKKSNALLLMLLPAFALSSCGVGDYAASYKTIKTALDQVKAKTTQVAETGYAKMFASKAQSNVFYTIPSTSTDAEGKEVNKIAKVTSKVSIEVNDGAFRIDNGIYQGKATIQFKSSLKDTTPKPEVETPEGEEPVKPSSTVKNEGTLNLTATYYVEGLETIVALEGSIEKDAEPQTFKLYNKLPLDLNAAVHTNYKDLTLSFLDFLPEPEKTESKVKKAAEEPSTPSLAPTTENMIRYLKLDNKEEGKNVDLKFELASKQRPLVPSDTNDITIGYEANYTDGLVTKFNTKTNRVIIKNSPSNDKKVNANFVENAKVTYSLVKDPLAKLNLSEYTLTDTFNIQTATSILDYFANGLTSYFGQIESIL